jgi:hypothetical protein
MTTKAGGRWVPIFVTGLFAGLLVCGAGSSWAAEGSDDAGASTASHRSRDDAHHKSSKTAEPTKTKQRATDAADTGGLASAAIPPSVANANAQLMAADTTIGSARWNSPPADDNAPAAANDAPVAQPAAESEVVAPDQLNDVDRALREDAPAAPTLAVASADPAAAPAGAETAAGSESSTWDQTSLIGKIFIGFGALLTLASAARMFIA